MRIEVIRGLEGTELLRAMAKEYPFMAIEIKRESDPDARWDFDSKRDYSLQPYQHTVIVTVIAAGMYVSGRADLSGTWLKPGDHEYGNIGGYLPGMLGDAIKDMIRHLNDLHLEVATRVR